MGALLQPLRPLLAGISFLAFSLAPAAAGAELVEVTEGLVMIVAPERLRAEAEVLAERSGELLPTLERDLRQPLERPATLVLLPGDPPPELRELDAAAPPWASGFMLPRNRIGAIRMNRVTSYPFDGSEMVMVHELAHLLLHDKVGRNLPRWFEEAVATHEGRRRGTRDLLVFTTSTFLGRIPSLDSLDRGFAGGASAANLSYAVSFEFLSWALRRHGPELVPTVLDLTERNLQRERLPLDARTPFEAAWQEATGEPLLASEQSWRRSAYRFTRWLPILLGSNWLWVGMALLTVLAFLVRRRRKLEQYRRWEEEELAAAHRVDALSLVDDSLGEDTLENDEGKSPLVN